MILVFWKNGNRITCFPVQLTEVRAKGHSHTLQGFKLLPFLLQSVSTKDSGSVLSTAWSSFPLGKTMLWLPTILGKGKWCSSTCPDSSLLHPNSLLLLLHAVRTAAKGLSKFNSRYHGQLANSAAPLLRSYFHIWAMFPCHCVGEHSFAEIRSERWWWLSLRCCHSHTKLLCLKGLAGNANNKQTIITHNCGWTQPLMTLFNTTSTLWRASSLRSHAPRSISRMALPTVIPTAYSNCLASTVQGS